jgi:hypothetical protein
MFDSAIKRDAKSLRRLLDTFLIPSLT